MLLSFVFHNVYEAESQVHQQNAVNLEKLSSDEEINNAQRQILELRAREAMERERTNKRLQGKSEMS